MSKCMEHMASVGNISSLANGMPTNNGTIQNKLTQAIDWVQTETAQIAVCNRAETQFVQHQ